MTRALTIDYSDEVKLLVAVKRCELGRLLDDSLSSPK